MPPKPKPKPNKPPKSANPTPQLDQPKCKCLTLQLHKPVSQITRRNAGSESSLPDIAELVSALSKQGKKGEDKGEDKVRYKGNGEDKDKGKGMAKGKGKGGGGGEGKHVDKGKSKSKSKGKGKGKDEYQDEGNGNSNGNSKDKRSKPVGHSETSCKPKTKGHKGCPAGLAGYQKAEEWKLVEGVGMYKPQSKIGWRKTAKYYNSELQKDCWHKWDILKNKWNWMVKRKKPTGDREGSRLHNAILEAEDQHVAQEETGMLNDNGWSAAHTLELEVIDISSDSKVLVHSNALPIKWKVKPAVKTKSGTTYYTVKDPNFTKTKKTPNKHCRNAQSTIDNISKILERKIIDVDGTHKATGIAKERCHQLEQQANSVTMAMAVYGIPIPKGALGAAGGPSIGNALASFLCEHLLAVNPAVACEVTHKTPKTDSTPSPNCPGLASISNHSEPDNIDPILCEDMDHNFVEEASKVLNMPSSSKLTISEKGKLPVHPGY
ncbi:hypothetical protein RHS03_08971, partial [Rhizoctonia solani]